MTDQIDHETLHRTAKYFMDSGRVASAEDAMELLRGFAVTVEIDGEAAASAHGQAALLTLVNLARRTFLGGVEVVGSLLVPTIGKLMPNRSLAAAVKALGGTVVTRASRDLPTFLIGSGEAAGAPAWRLHWAGWSGGVVSATRNDLKPDLRAMALTPLLAAAFAVAEAFSHFAGDHPLAGRRSAGLSLWNPAADWLADDGAPDLAYLPTALWLIGLGNLGQAYAWSLATLPYPEGGNIEILLQDFDVVGTSNDSTSLLSNLAAVGRKKARVIAEWLDERGFLTVIEERRFNAATRWSNDDPGVALCGVDNAIVRSQLDGAGFPLVVEAGLGAGPQAFRSIAIHTLPASRPSSQIWRAADEAAFDPSDLPAYQALKTAGMDECGLAQLASRTVGVPFVGLAAATLVIAELLRRLHGGPGFEVASVSTLAPDAAEHVAIDAPIYSHGHIEI